jgi:hypothetical protein
MNLGWGAPAMLWGAALVGVPILIHLMNRRRYQVRAFAAMSFLRQAFAKRKRRMRMENLLLLLLRCAAVAMAALAMALPFVPPDSLLSLVTAGRRDLVLIVDRSASSSRLVAPDTSLDDRVLSRIRARVARMTAGRGDTVTLITPGSGDLLPGPIGTSPAALLAVLDAGLEPPGGVADMVAAARLVKERVRSIHRGRLEIEVFTDLQEASWGQNLGPLFAEILEDGGGSLRIVDVAADLSDRGNLGVENLASEGDLLLAGQSATFTAVIRNHGDVVRRGVVGTFYLDEKSQRRFEDIEVPPRGLTSVSFRLLLADAGPHHLEFALEPDELPFDDRRSLAFEAREGVDVLLVDGQFGGSPLDGATTFLELALDPNSQGGDDFGFERYRTVVMGVSKFEEAGRDLYRYDAIVLANVAVLSESTAVGLAEVVASGTPLMLFTGDRFDPLMANERLGELLPARVGPARGDALGTGEHDYVNLVLDDPPAPGLALFADPRLAVLLQVPVLAWNELVPGENSEVLAWFADALGKRVPAIVQGTHGQGRVVLVGTTADDSWSLLPRQPATWVPLVHELISSLTATDPSLTNLPLGQAPNLVLDGEPSAVRLVSPSGAMQNVGRPDVTPLGRRSVLSMEATPLREAGAWKLEVDFVDANQPRQMLALAALPDAREGDLRRIDGPSLDRVLAGVAFTLGEQVEDAEDDSGDSGGDGSLFRALLWALLVCLAGEALLARSMGGPR